MHTRIRSFALIALLGLTVTAYAGTQLTGTGGCSYPNTPGPSITIVKNPVLNNAYQISQQPSAITEDTYLVWNPAFGEYFIFGVATNHLYGELVFSGDPPSVYHLYKYENGIYTETGSGGFSALP